MFDFSVHSYSSMNIDSIKLCLALFWLQTLATTLIHQIFHYKLLKYVTSAFRTAFRAVAALSPMSSDLNDVISSMRADSRRCPRHHSRLQHLEHEHFQLHVVAETQTVA